MKDITDRELFKKALTEAQLIELDRVAEGVTAPIRISRQHKRRMKAILDGTYEAERRPITTKKLICILAAAILSLLLIGCTVYRDQIYDMVLRFHEKGVDVFFKSEETPSAGEITELRSPTYVPEGYAETSRESHWYDNIVKWENADGEYIEFEQTLMGGSFSTFDTEHGEQKTVIMGGIEVFCFHHYLDDNYAYTWTDNEYRYRMSVSDGLGDEEIEKIVTSIAPEG